MKANIFHIAVLYAMGGLTATLLAQKPSSLDLGRLSPSQLVKFVTYQNRSDSYDGVIECVPNIQKKRDQEAIERLVALGERSAPAIEGEFTAVSKQGENGQSTPNIQQLFYAYARIRGPRAFPRLREMELSQQQFRAAIISRDGAIVMEFSPAAADLDGAIAVALGLTSYLSSAQPEVRLFALCPGQQPQQFHYALDQMIVAWERGDRLWFETSLGETAAHAVAVKDDDEWQAFRKTFWRDVPNAAVGYKFQVPGILNEPSIPIPSQAHVPNEDEKFDFDTTFYDRNGRSCGHMMMKFIQSATAKPPGYLRYAVDNPNIADVLQLVSACARQ